MKITIAVLLCAFLAGCGSLQPQPPAWQRYLTTYSNDHLPEAEKGGMKWSDYYKSMLNIASTSDAPAGLQTIYFDLLQIALSYEAGTATKADLEMARTSARVKGAQLNEQLRREDQQRALIALSIMQSMPQIQPVQYTPIQHSNGPATPAVPNLMPQPQPQTVTAFWTGKQQQVQTVTNQVGWSCEYNYAGRLFWRTFVGVCPTSTQAQ